MDITVHTDHNPLETIFKRPLASAPRRLQSMMLTLQRYTFKVEYRKGSSLHIADTLSRAPLPATTHKPIHEENVYRVEFEADEPDLSGFHDATLNDIRVASSTRRSMLHKLHAAHRGPEFTIRHARNCLYWPGLNGEIKDMCDSCGICAQHAQQHPREPLKTYPVPTLPWQLVSQDLFELNGSAYLVTVDHYSDFYEINKLSSIQSSTIIAATKQHFGRYGIPHTLLTDNGSQYSPVILQIARQFLSTPNIS